MKINEIFYSLQGEGLNAGIPAIFIRFSGCNLKCAFCDTRHEPFQELTEDEIIREVYQYPAKLVVVTGGEPTLQLTETLVAKLHALGKAVAIETNGTVRLSDKLASSIDWVTLSPKFEFCPNAAVNIQRFDELKVVFTGQPLEAYDSLASACPDNCFLQPCDTGNTSRNAQIVDAAVDYIKKHPRWRLSLQIHKLLGLR